jgi:hypothetical protein
MSEVNALKTLRETTLAHLSQSDYERILKAVEVGGIDSLTGTAAMVVKSAVLKHGAHDQSSHNPKKGGGGAGGGAGGSTGSPAALGESHKIELAAAERNVRGAASKAAAQGGPNNPYIAPPTKAAVKAANSINSARSAKTVEDAKFHTDKAQGHLTQAFEQYENENYHDAARVMYDTRTNLTSIMTAASGGRAITPLRTGAADIKSPAFPMGTYGESWGD